MGVRAGVRRVINKALSPFGAELINSYQKNAINERYSRLVKELSGELLEHRFSDLRMSREREILLAQLIGTSVGQGIYIAGTLARSLPVEGDVCEFGVAQGATSALLAHEMMSSDKRLWLFDSFKGLSTPSPEDVLTHDIFSLGMMRRYAGEMSYPPALARQRVKEVDFPDERLEIVEGYIQPNRKPKRLPEQVCFAYLDMDLYEPTKTALELLDDRLPRGARLIVDDYEFFSEGVKKAVDEFIVAREDVYLADRGPLHLGHFCVISKV